MQPFDKHGTRYASKKNPPHIVGDLSGKISHDTSLLSTVLNFGTDFHHNLTSLIFGRCQKILTPPAWAPARFSGPPCPLDPKIVKLNKNSKYSHVIYQSIGNSKQITK